MKKQEEAAPLALSEAKVRALYTRGIIDRSTWALVLRAFRGLSSPMTEHALHTCELAIEVMVEDAINAACKSIQDRLAVKTGDLAAATLSDGTIERELTRYVHAELEMAGSAGEDEPPKEEPPKEATP